METLKLKKSLKVDLALTTGVALLAAMLWYVYWVQPRDEFLHAVMDCMEDCVSGMCVPFGWGG